MVVNEAHPPLWLKPSEIQTRNSAFAGARNDDMPIDIENSL